MKIFKEVQFFRQTWLMILIATSIIVPMILITVEYYKENSNMSTKEFALALLLLIACILPIFFFKLTTRIDEKGIHYQFFPFHFSLKTIRWIDIHSVEIRKYNAISEYGGWGLKGGSFWKKNNGKAINVSGNMGIQLELKNGKKLLIGTQKENDAKRVLETYQHKIQQL